MNYSKLIMNFSSKFISVYKYYVTPACLFGSSIGAFNLYNMKQSPVYNPPCNINQARIVGMCGIKGFIYGFCMPISACGVCFDLIYSGERFEEHFVPFSKYGNR